jgi:hypothetical protein
MIGPATSSRLDGRQPNANLNKIGCGSGPIAPSIGTVNFEGEVRERTLDADANWHAVLSPLWDGRRRAASLRV